MKAQNRDGRNGFKLGDVVKLVRPVEIYLDWREPLVVIPAGTKGTVMACLHGQDPQVQVCMGNGIGRVHLLPKSLEVVIE